MMSKQHFPALMRATKGMRHSLIQRMSNRALSFACGGQTRHASRSWQSSHRVVSMRTHATAATQQVVDMRLSGGCGCGAVTWHANGRSSLNFTCHCSICREATGKDSTTCAGFQPDQVQWEGFDKAVEKTPQNSKNPRFYCGSCGDYLAEDATRPFGLMALPLDIATSVNGEKLSNEGVPPQYLPNHHIFYADRVVDADDGLPKWKTIPQGLPVDVGRSNASSSGVVTGDARRYDKATGEFSQDIHHISPPRSPEPKVYQFTEVDPTANHVTLVHPDKVQERVQVKYDPSPEEFIAPSKLKRDVVIIGGGHNGLVSAAYLAKKGLDVCVLERRHCVGGAAVTEEIIPGFKFSRASYLAGLLRPSVVKDLELERHGLEYLPRDPSSFTPTKEEGKYLLLGSDEAKNYKNVSMFSEKDAKALPEYEKFLDGVRELIQPLLEGPPPNPFEGKRAEKVDTVKRLLDLYRTAIKHKDEIVPFYELFTGPASHILDRWFESEIVKTTLATDAVIGAMVAPSQAGSAYVLLHHVMGEAAGKKGVWAYVRGGMGAISEAIAASARESGAEIVNNATVRRILFHESTAAGGKPKVRGVEMVDGTILEADTVLANTNPYHTFLELLPGLARDSGFEEEESPLPEEFQHHIRYADYSCGAFKINCAIERVPNFICKPNKDGGPQPQHHGTIHFENKVEEIENAWREASMGIPATRPVVEMTIPSALDNTVSPSGKHVCQLFVQFAPYHVDPKIGNWADPQFKEKFVERVFSVVEEFAPGFRDSVIGYDALSPLDLERIFGLEKGNIFHGSMALHQLGYTRPAFGYSSHRTPMDGLYLCGSGAHPGGGVMGAPGRNCAKVVLSDKGL